MRADAYSIARKGLWEVFSFEKRKTPTPPKEKPGGISISPRAPLKRHKGKRSRPLPFGFPSPRNKGAAAEAGEQGVPDHLKFPPHTTNAAAHFFDRQGKTQPAEEPPASVSAVIQGRQRIPARRHMPPAEAFFFLHGVPRSFFGKRKERGGYIPAAKPHTARTAAVQANSIG